MKFFDFILTKNTHFSQRDKKKLAKLKIGMLV